MIGPRSDPNHAPDLTRSIMGQLGYMQIDPRVARRRALKRWLVRACGLVLVVGAGLVALQIRQAQEGIPQRADVTLPDAVQEDMARRRSVFQRISTLIPAPATPAAQPEPQTLPPIIDRSGLGIVDDPAFVIPVGDPSESDETNDADDASSDDDAPAPIA